MAKKTVKIKNEELPLLIGDLNIDASVLEKIKVVQDKFSARFEKEVEEVKAESLKRYTSKIETLTKAKAEMLKEYNEELKKYRTLVKDLKASVKKTTPKSTSKKKTISTPRKKTTTGKITSKKTRPKK